jgi:type IV secretory pathway VirB2 component (pilin)
MDRPDHEDKNQAQSAASVVPPTAPEKTVSPQEIRDRDWRESIWLQLKAIPGERERGQANPVRQSIRPLVLEMSISHLDRIKVSVANGFAFPSMFAKSTLIVLAVVIFAPLGAHAQGSPFDTGFTAIQSLFTGTIAKVASLVAIVIGGYGFAHGEPGAKKALAGVAAGTGIAVLAVNVLSWLWGV